MLFKSNLFSQASGSLGGTTFSRNAGGMYVRNRAIPVNPNTTTQQAIRNCFASANAAWTTTLTDAQRQSWADYAAAVTVKNKLGDQTNITGQNMFVRSYVPTLHAGGTPVLDGPTVLTLPQTPFVNTIEIDAGPPVQADIAGGFNQALSAAEAGIVIVYLGLPQSNGTNYFKGPYRFAATDAVAETDTTWGIDGITPGQGYTIATGQKIPVRVSLCTDDGRLSNAFQDIVVVEAP